MVPKVGQEDIVNDALCHSKIWRYTKVLKLTENMQVLQSGDGSSPYEFIQWVLNIGNGVDRDKRRYGCNSTQNAFIEKFHGRID